MKLNLIVRFFSAALITLYLSLLTVAQMGGSIRGTVTSSVNNLPVSNVSVQITQLKRTIETNENGVYKFINVPAGTYNIVTHIEGFSDRASTVSLSASGNQTLDFSLSLTSLREEVIVTATGAEESVFESFQSVNGVGSLRIREQASTSIGEVLEREAGVGKRSFGPGTSRPVIRGFDGDRVLVLQDGIRTGSVGSQSGDHGEPIDALGLERLEVVKGPATLLYGSNAVGGVVNAVTTDEDDPHEGIRGFFTGLGATNNRQGGASGGVEYGYKKFLFNASASGIREGNYRTPFGAVPNSASRYTSGSGSVGYFGDKGFVQASYRQDRRRYGVPYAPLFEEGVLLSNSAGESCEAEEDVEGAEPEPCQFDIFAIRNRFSNALPPTLDEAIDLRLRTHTGKVRGGFRDFDFFINGMNFSLNYSDYTHNEIETADGVDEIATTFDNDTFSYRSVFEQKPSARLTGRFGFEGFNRTYQTVGAEALVQGKVKHNMFSVFALEEINFLRVALQFGGRVESNRYNPRNDVDYINRNFTGFSGAAAARIRLWRGSSFIANFTSSYRAPALEELYNEGAHIGTVTFEIGDQNLRRERSNGIELSFRQNISRVRISGSFFYYNIDDFVFLAPQDADGDGNVDVEDNLPIANYLQQDSRFTGADLTVDVDINKYVNAFLIGDSVSAKLRETDIPLPRITPARARVGLDFRYKGLSVRPEGVFASRKGIDDVFTLETPTAGYGFFNINSSYTYATERYAHIISVSGFNLNDRLFRNAQSFIKDLAPEPGRGLKASYTIRFF